LAPRRHDEPTSRSGIGGNNELELLCGPVSGSAGIRRLITGGMSQARSFGGAVQLAQQRSHTV
jgi:hypothetical protein